MNQLLDFIEMFAICLQCLLKYSCIFLTPWFFFDSSFSELMFSFFDIIIWWLQDKHCLKLFRREYVKLIKTKRSRKKKKYKCFQSFIVVMRDQFIQYNTSIAHGMIRGRKQPLFVHVDINSYICSFDLSSG